MKDLIERLHKEAAHTTVTLQMRLVAIEAATALEQQAAEIANKDEEIKLLHIRLNAATDARKNLQSQLDTAIQSSAHWQHQCTELQAKLSAMEKQEPVASDKPTKLDEIEQYRLQMAGISTAALGYWREGNDIHPDYDTVALRDVAKLYAKYDRLYKAAPKVAQPLTDEQVKEIVDDCTTDDGGYDIWCDGNAVARAIEAAHNIGGQQP